jgi:plasmid stabilization system protein ParE
VTAVRLRRIAQRDLREAIAWYRERNEDVARRFAFEVSQALALLEEFPFSGGFVPGIQDPAIRQVPVRKFPYHLVFIRLADRISVLAIAHNRRKPGYWNE